MRVTTGLRTHLRVLISAAIITGALVGPAAAAPLGPWEPSPALELSTSMSRADDAGVAVAPDGTTTAFWSDDGGDLVARTRASGWTTYGAVETIGGQLLDSDGGPGGRIAVVTSALSGGTTTVRLRIREAGAAGFSAPVSVVTTTGDVWNADVELGPSGTIVVAWSVGVGGFHDIYARIGTVGDGSATLGTAIPFATGTLSYARAHAAIGPDGRIAVSWNARVGTVPAGALWEIRTSVRAAAGGDFGGPVTALAFAADTSAESVATEYDAHNRLVVAYMALVIGSGGSPYPITVGTVTLPAGQSAFDAPVVASTYTGESFPVALGIAPEGTITLGWIDRGATNQPWAATLSAGGTAFGPAEDLAAAGSVVAADVLRLVVAPDGTAVAAFWQQGNSGDGQVGTPYARVREAGSASFGAPSVLGQGVDASGGSGSEYRDVRMAVGVAATGDSTVLWTDAAGGTWTPKTRTARRPSPPAAATAASTLLVSSLTAQIRQGTIVVRATVLPSTNGVARLVATTRRNDRSPRRWRCTGEADVQANVRAKLTCTLRLGARRQLDRGALWLAGSFRLTPSTGIPGETYRGLVIPRRAR